MDETDELERIRQDIEDLLEVTDRCLWTASVRARYRELTAKETALLRASDLVAVG